MVVTNYEGHRIEVHQLKCDCPCFLGASCKPDAQHTIYVADLRVAVNKTLSDTLDELMQGVDEINSIDSMF